MGINKKGVMGVGRCVLDENTLNADHYLCQLILLFIDGWTIKQSLMRKVVLAISRKMFPVFS